MKPRNSSPNQMFVVRGVFGFTIIELFVAIAIISVLSLFLFAGMRRVRDSANKAGCVVRLKAIGGALIAYAGDRNGLLPYGEEGPSDNRTPIPFWYAPYTLASALVGDRGSKGYLPYTSTSRKSNEIDLWSEMMHSPGDPNRELYIKQLGYSDSYIYRQTEYANSGWPGKRIRLMMNPKPNQRPRWLVCGRFGAFTGTKLPYKRTTYEKEVTPAHPLGGADSYSVACPWYAGPGTNVLYEDGTVMFRRFPNETLGL
jgi:type II secretory pathway pseudopilin PulG